MALFREQEADHTTTDWVDQMLTQAIQGRVSDIHLEPRRNGFEILFRIDGILQPYQTLQRHQHETIASRIKVLGSLDITNHTLPQDGNFEFKEGETIYSVRVSTYPTIYGEAIVLRILNRRMSLMPLEQLGLDEEQLSIIQSLIIRPHGSILVTGPSGSGKTTLLYSIVNTINTGEKNIVTIEDPVELRMEGIRQAQMNESRHFDFATAVRAMLRQDPDVIMVGEIRDKETAQIASQSALTGTVVLSTFHTLSIFAVVTRLLEMGVPRSVIAQGINGVVASRLVRKICESCKEPHELTARERQLLGPRDVTKGTFYVGKGCDRCHNSGFLGRVGIFEVLQFDDDIRALITEQDVLSETFLSFERRKARGLNDSAIDKVFQGVTTIDEVIRVLGSV